MMGKRDPMVYEIFQIDWLSWRVRSRNVSFTIATRFSYNVRMSPDWRAAAVKRGGDGGRGKSGQQFSRARHFGRSQMEVRTHDTVKLPRQKQLRHSRAILLLPPPSYSTFAGHAALCSVAGEWTNQCVFLVIYVSRFCDRAPFAWTRARQNFLRLDHSLAPARRPIPLCSLYYSFFHLSLSLSFLNAPVLMSFFKNFKTTVKFHRFRSIKTFSSNEISFHFFFYYFFLASNFLTQTWFFIEFWTLYNAFFLIFEKNTISAEGEKVQFASNEITKEHLSPEGWILFFSLTIVPCFR